MSTKTQTNKFEAIEWMDEFLRDRLAELEDLDAAYGIAEANGDVEEMFALEAAARFVTAAIRGCGFNVEPAGNGTYVLV